LRDRSSELLEGISLAEAGSWEKHEAASDRTIPAAS
jgi:hypothetical protein